MNREPSERRRVITSWRFPVVFAALALAGRLAADPVSLRADLEIRRVLDTGNNSSIRIDVDPVSGAIHYLRRSGSVYKLTLGAGSATTERIYRAGDTGVDAPMGFAFGPDGTLYILGNVRSGATTSALLRRGLRTDPGSDVREWSTAMTTAAYPRSNTAFDHNFNGIAVSPDGGFLFVNSGSRTDHGEVQSNGGLFPGVREVPLTSAIFRIPATAEALVLSDDEAALVTGGHLFADGVRNAFDLAFAPDGELFATENSGDRDDPEELNWIREGRHYGFPWRMGGNDTPMRFPGYDVEADRLVNHNYTAYRNGLFYDDPGYPPPPEGVVLTEPVPNVGPDADSYRDPASGAIRDAGDRGEAIATFTAHRSPLGLFFDVDGALGGDYRGDGFVLGWTRGRADGEPSSGPFRDPGEDLLHLELTRAGDGHEARVTRIAGGFANPIDAVLVGNRAYVLEYGGDGTIWEVSFPGAERGPRFRRGHANGDDLLDISDPVKVLVHLFLAGELACRDAADANDDGAVNIADATYLLGFLFTRGEAPPEPYPGCGEDPTPDDEECEETPVECER